MLSNKIFKIPTTTRNQTFYLTLNRINWKQPLHRVTMLLWQQHLIRAMSGV